MKTPINSGILQSDIAFDDYKPVDADLSDYAGSGMSWNAVTRQLTSTGGTGLDGNTTTSGAIGLVGDGVTDNTAALQAWIDGVATAKVNSTLLVEDGVYVFSGALQDGSYRNAQILLPTVAITDATYSITIRGYHAPSYIPWPDTTMPTPKGAIFRSTLATGGGTQPSFIGGKGPSGGAGPDLSYVMVRLEDMIFQTIANPLISCLNLSHFSVVELRGDVIVMAGTKLGENDSTQPTTATSYGLILPPNNYGMVQKVENVCVSNFYTGVLMGELTHVQNMACQICVYALEFPFAYHITLIERIVDWHCKYGIHMVGAHNFQVNQYDVERAVVGAGHWYERVYDVDDATNLATADITWRTVVAYVGASNTFAINGGSNIRARRAGNDITTVATLPTSPSIGQICTVSDGTAALAFGATVTGGGSTKYLVWYNGTNWTVMGK